MPNKKSVKSKMIRVIYILLLLFPCFEIALRIVGGTPYKNENYSIQITPHAAFIGDDSLGIKVNPGNFKIILNEKIRFKTNHNKLGNRAVTGKISSSDSLKIVTMGCSFTYGYGVNDNEHFTSLLQEKLPKSNFSNLGVIGYGTVQSYLQLLKIIKENKSPNLVLLNFSSFHLDRNALTPYYRRALKVGFNQSMDSIEELMERASFPYSLSRDGVEVKFQDWKSMYQDWKGRSYFASINYLQTAWDKIQSNKLDLSRISEEIIIEMNNLCKNNEIEFVVGFLDSDTSIKNLIFRINKEKIKTVEIDFDFSDTTLTNLPYDMHPNSGGHKFIADKWYDYLTHKSLQ